MSRIEPDEFINASEIARRLRRSRESVRKLVAESAGQAASSSGFERRRKASPLWRWLLRSLQWVAENRHSRQYYPGGSIIRRINALLGIQQVVGSLTEVQRMWHTIVLAPRSSRLQRQGKKERKSDSAQRRGQPAARRGRTSHRRDPTVWLDGVPATICPPAGASVGVPQSSASCCRWAWPSRTGRQKENFPSPTAPR